MIINNKYMKNKNWIDKVLHNSLFLFLLIGVLIFLFYNYQENIFNYLDPNNSVGKIEKLGFIILLLGTAIAFWQLFIAKKSTDQNDKNIEISLNNAIDERFKGAIEILGSEKASTRLGAINTLHHLAKETSEKDKSYTKSVFEILCSYIREKTNEEEYIKKYVDTENKKGNPSIEIQTIIDLLFIIEIKSSPYKFFKADLNNSKLVGADLKNANLKNANLYNVNLSCADLESANLKNAVLCNANLEKAVLCNANLESTNLYIANLKNANLKNANLNSANLNSANLNSANLKNANLENVNLENAYLENAYLSSAILENANLSNTNLSNTILSNTNLKNSILKNSILKNAKIDGIILTGANLKG